MLRRHCTEKPAQPGVRGKGRNPRADSSLSQKLVLTALLPGADHMGKTERKNMWLWPFNCCLTLGELPKFSEHLSPSSPQMVINTSFKAVMRWCR